MNKIFKTVGIIAILVVGLRFLAFFTYGDTDDKTHQVLFNEDYAIYALNLPQDIGFAGEAVPFNDPDIYERYDRELLVNTYWQSQTLLFFKRSAKYFPVIEPILKKNGIPEDFKYIALIESGLTNIVSPAGAVGFWQIMEHTGKQYGLEITKEVDERYHLEKATQVACDYLNEAYEEFGSWTLAAASYNMGINGVRKQLERQNASNYYGLTLNEETARYVFRIMAVKEIQENPEKYGFRFRKKDLYENIPCNVLKIDSTISNLGSFANELGINYRILKYHNPWLRYEYLPNPTGKNYFIKIPKEGHYELLDEAEVNDDAANGNGMAEYGESISLNLAMKNLGSETASAVELTLESTDMYVSISNANATLGNIDPDQIVSLTDVFGIDIAEDIPDGHSMAFLITASDGTDEWESSFNVTAYSPVLDFAGYSILDPSGNNNGKLDPGETVEVLISLTNTGSAEAFNVMGELTSPSAFVTINTGDPQEFGDVSAGGEAMA